MPQHKRKIYTENGIKKLKCSVCGYKLPFEEYDNDKKTSTGKSSYCKTCRKSMQGKKRKVPSNCGIDGIYLYECLTCKRDFTTKRPNKVFCSDKCRKRDWYIKNEQPSHLKH